MRVFCTAIRLRALPYLTSVFAKEKVTYHGKTHESATAQGYAESATLAIAHNGDGGLQTRGGQRCAGVKRMAQSKRDGLSLRQE